MKFFYKSILILIFQFLIFNYQSFSQNPLVKQWDKRFGGSDWDELTCIQKTADGGYILGGKSLSDSSGDKTQSTWGGNYDYWIVKIDAFGNKQWDRDFGGTGGDELNSIQQTSDGGYILGGFSASGIGGDKSQDTWGQYDYWIVKIDSSGSKQWDKNFGGTGIDQLFAIQQTNDKGYILGGISTSGISGDKSQATWGQNDYDYWVVKTDSLGNKQWDKDFGGTDLDFLYCIEQTDDMGYLLGGTSFSDSSGDKTQPLWGGRDYWIIKTDSLGNMQWDKDYGGISTDMLYSLTQTTDRGYILGGESNSGISGDKTQTTWGGPLDKDFWIIKIDSLGNKQWDKDFGGTDLENRFKCISQTTDGGYLFSGVSYSNISGDKTEDNLGPEQTWAIKTDSFGIKQWDKTLRTNTSAGDFAGFAIQTNNECYAFANFTLAGTGGDKTQPCWGNYDYWIIKFCDSTLTTSIPQLPNTQLPFSIFPNPTTSIIQLTFNTKHNAQLMCEIINVMGERVWASPLASLQQTSPLTPLHGRGEGYATLDVSFLAKGMYVVRVGDGTVWENKKLVVE
jgi:hypothetical protein